LRCRPRALIAHDVFSPVFWSSPFIMTASEHPRAVRQSPLFQIGQARVDTLHAAIKKLKLERPRAHLSQCRHGLERSLSLISCAGMVA
jgi:hypothetical protein